LVEAEDAVNVVADHGHTLRDRAWRRRWGWPLATGYDILNTRKAILTETLPLPKK
jgi:hypothetical protein